MAHTPGSWIEESGFIMADQGGFICDPHCQGGPEDHAERDANARLIAAAPELLEALQTLVAMHKCNYDRGTEDYKWAIANASAAIAKATGK